MVGYVDMGNGVGKGEIFVDGDDVGDIIIRVEYDIGGVIGGV